MKVEKTGNHDLPELGLPLPRTERRIEYRKIKGWMNLLVGLLGQECSAHEKIKRLTGHSLMESGSELLAQMKPVAHLGAEHKPSPCWWKGGRR